MSDTMNSQGSNETMRRMLADPDIAAHLADLQRDERIRQADQNRQDQNRLDDQRRQDQRRQDDIRRDDQRRSEAKAAEKSAETGPTEAEKAEQIRLSKHANYERSRQVLNARDERWSEEEKAAARARAEKAVPKLAADADMWKIYSDMPQVVPMMTDLPGQTTQQKAENFMMRRRAGDPTLSKELMEGKHIVSNDKERFLFDQPNYSDLYKSTREQKPEPEKKSHHVKIEKAERTPYVEPPKSAAEQEIEKSRERAR